MVEESIDLPCPVAHPRLNMLAPNHTPLDFSIRVIRVEEAAVLTRDQIRTTVIKSHSDMPSGNLVLDLTVATDHAQTINSSVFSVHFYFPTKVLKIKQGSTLAD
jgi:hypothetical protein